jgi:hypothetical protein
MGGSVRLNDDAGERPDVSWSDVLEQAGSKHVKSIAVIAACANGAAARRWWTTSRSTARSSTSASSKRRVAGTTPGAQRWASERWGSESGEDRRPEPIGERSSQQYPTRPFGACTGFSHQRIGIEIEGRPCGRARGRCSTDRPLPIRSYVRTGSPGAVSERHDDHPDEAAWWKAVADYPSSVPGIVGELLRDSRSVVCDSTEADQAMAWARAHPGVVGRRTGGRDRGGQFVAPLTA